MPVVRRPLNFTPAGPAINVTLMEHFVRNPPVLFSIKERTTRWRKQRRQYLSPDPNKIMACARSAKEIFWDSTGGCLWVHTEAELETLTKKLLNLPIFLTALVRRSHQKTSKKTVISQGTAAVIVNTKHVQIHHHLKTLLAEAMELMREGRNFAVEFDFNPVLADWLEAVFARQDEALVTCLGKPTSYTSLDARITVTNYGERAPIFTCSDCCKSMGDVVTWTCCLPCCCVVCPIYRLQRHLRVTDIGGGLPEELYATSFNPTMEITDAEVARLQSMRRAIESHARANDSPLQIDSVGRVFRNT